MRIANILVIAAILAPLLGGAADKVHQSALLQYDKQIDGIIGQMTLEEKVNMLHAKFMFVSDGIERLGIADI